MNLNTPAKRLDEVRLARYLEKRIDGFLGPVQLEKFAGGQSNPTFLLSTPTDHYVLRRKPLGPLLKSAHAVDREFRILESLQYSPVPVAKPYCLCVDATILGSMFYVMSYEPGRIFWDSAIPELQPAERAPIFEELIRVLATVHDLDVDAMGLADLGKPGYYFERQLDRWVKQYRSAETERIDDMETLVDWLTENLPKNDGSVSLIHGDYRLDNVIFDMKKPVARAVLDWELSTIGHPMADLAYFCMSLRLPTEGPASGLQGLDRGALGIPSETRIIEHYCEQRGIDGVQHWNFYLAFSFFRLAAICQGVLKRALNGNAASEQAFQVGASVPTYARMAMDAITESK